MAAVLLVIHLIVAVAIIITILIQPSEAGGFMGNSGSMSNMMAPRRGADVLTRMTTILAGLFFLTSLLLAISANQHPRAKSILDVDTGDKPAVEHKVEAPVQGDATVTPETAPAEDKKVEDKKVEDEKKSGATDTAPAKKETLKKKSPKAPVSK